MDGLFSDDFLDYNRRISRVIPAKVKAVNDGGPIIDAARAIRTSTTQLRDHHHKMREMTYTLPGLYSMSLSKPDLRDRSQLNLQLAWQNFQGTLIVNITLTKKKQINYAGEKVGFLTSEDKEVIIS